MSRRAFGETVVTLFVITDPFGNAPVFLAVTRNLSPKERQRAALRACLYAGSLILGFAAFGAIVLRHLNVSIGNLSIAGGLLLLIVSLEMLRGIDFPTGESKDVALVPLATPLVAGPGAIATAMVLWRSHPGAGGHTAVVLAILAVVACVGISLLVAERLTRRLGPGVFSFLTRVFGLLVAAIAAQLVVNGIKSLT